MKKLLLAILLLFSATALAELPPGMPDDVKVHRHNHPDRSIVYHHFYGECGHASEPVWSVLLTKDDKYIIGSPSTIRLERNTAFVAEVYHQRPIQIYNYEECDGGGIEYENISQ